MKLLISTENNARFSLAVGEEKMKKIKTVEKPYKQSELLLKEIDILVKSEKSKVKSIIVVSGPGQFSALRIGIATANALAHGLKLPIVGVELKKSWLELPEKEKLEKVWQAGIKELKTAKLGTIVVPKYGKEPNIT